MVMVGEHNRNKVVLTLSMLSNDLALLAQYALEFGSLRLSVLFQHQVIQPQNIGIVIGSADSIEHNYCCFVNHYDQKIERFLSSIGRRVIDLKNSHD